MSQNYKETMNLPKTDFPMRASLVTREPERLKQWNDQDIYARVMSMRDGAPNYTLHDGPPYANGHIHLGTAMNKILKDFIIKYKTMQGFQAPYVPGWDCHGQPIEHMVEKKLGPEKMAKIDQATLRRLCRDWATNFIDIQREEFKRLGVRGDWENPYLTYLPEYEAGNVTVFKKMYESGAVYRGRKPIHWCVRCHTALAEAEIEYADEPSDSLYVKFALNDVPSAFAAVSGTSTIPARIVIWTTTPWTLPANVAVALAPDADYVAVIGDGELLIVAEALSASVAEDAGWEDVQLLTGADGETVRVKGSELSGLTYKLPVIEGNGVVIVGDHVELSTGTGAVHTAPGHGQDDYLVGQKFGLPTVMPVDDNGVFDVNGGPFEGLSVTEANPVIIQWLKDRDMVVAANTFTHSYPHCWRCKKPVIFRATDQWFVSMDKTKLQEKAMEEIRNVNWIPAWSINRISAMVGDRPDWCISRQRAWGVPIPVFKCAKCNETVATPETFDAVIDLFSKEGADAWFIKQPSEYLPEDTKCEACGSHELVPETDILDVWWESGVSHTSVVKARPELSFPADLYAEGSDQHRGWFQSSLLTSVGAYGVAPYKSVLTHGFVVDADGRKMSKSIGNTIAPSEIIAKYGADVMRLWVASSDYTQDVAISDEIMDRTSESYRRVRNTFKFLLSTVADFDVEKDAVAFSDMLELDQCALAQLSHLVERVEALYDELKFFAAFRATHDYINELSSVYMDVVKDRLYSDGADWSSRRSAQSALAVILVTLIKVLAPILTFTCDEAWEYLPASLQGGCDSVQMANWPKLDVPKAVRDELLQKYEVVFSVRDVVTKALEEARNDKRINKSQEACVAISAPQATIDSLSERGLVQLADMFIVSEVTFIPSEGDEVAVEVSLATGEKCPRCWNARELGVDSEHSDVCKRCAVVLSEIGA